LLAAGAVAAVATTALPGDAAPAIVVLDTRGEEVVRSELPESGSFALAYRHSYYGAPARERFKVTGDELRLTAIASPSAAVLDYYALAGDRTHGGRWLELRPAKLRRYERLPLIATATGRRTLLVGGDRFPLYAQEARHLTIEVER
jgi:hypothetical protein